MKFLDPTDPGDPCNKHDVTDVTASHTSHGETVSITIIEKKLKNISVFLCQNFSH